MREVADALRDELRRTGTKARAEGEKKYLKSQLRFFGVPVPAIRKLAKRFAKEHADLGRDALLHLTEELWTDHHESRTVAIAILEQFVDRLRAADFEFVESLLRRAEGWAHVDYLAVQIAGSLVQRYASCRKQLPRWSRDESFWIRRSAMLALLLELRTGDGDFAEFRGFADGMLHEKEFFIRKAIGWVLREASKSDPEAVRDYLETRLDRVSGLTLREGAKRLDPKLRDRLIEQYKNR